MSDQDENHNDSHKDSNQQGKSHYENIIEVPSPKQNSDAREKDENIDRIGQEIHRDQNENKDNYNNHPIDENQADNRGNQNVEQANRQPINQINRNQGNGRRQRRQQQPSVLKSLNINSRRDKTAIVAFLLILAAALYASFGLYQLKENSYILSTTYLKSAIEKLRQEKIYITRYLGIVNAHQSIRNISSIDDELITKIEKTKSSKLYQTGLLLLNCSKDFEKKDQQVVMYHQGIQNIINQSQNQ